MWYRSQPDQVGLCNRGSEGVLYKCPPILDSHDVINIKNDTFGFNMSADSLEYLVRFAPAVIGATAGGVIGGVVGGTYGTLSGLFGSDHPSTKVKLE